MESGLDSRAATLPLGRRPNRLLDAFRALYGGVRREEIALLLLLIAIAVFDPAQWWGSFRFAADNLLSVAVVLLFAAGLAAAIDASGADTLVAGAFAGREGRAVLIAALAGALSPLCSCGVVPLIAGLLAAGVPLAPVMAFWLASPVMDPAMFVLTAGMIGTEFALAKTVAAIAVGVLGGAVTGLLAGPQWGLATLRRERALRVAPGADAWAATRLPLHLRFWQAPDRRQRFGRALAVQSRRLGVLLAIAFVLESLMLAYLPPTVFLNALQNVGGWAIPIAVAISVPAYLNGSAAVPLVGSMIEMGMSPAVGLAFMVAGGITSVPAALAVWALVRPRVFALYLALAFAGSLAAGYGYAAWLAWQA